MSRSHKKGAKVKYTSDSDSDPDQDRSKKQSSKKASSGKSNHKNGDKKTSSKPSEKNGNKNGDSGSGNNKLGPLPVKTAKEMENITRRSQELAVNNAWWDARRDASKEWGGDSKNGERRCLIIGGLQCGARSIIRHIVTECSKGTAGAHLKGLIISPQERIDQELRLAYPEMRWCKFFDKEALNIWRALNARAEPFYVLVSGGILGMHIDDDLLEIIDGNKGTLIMHQPSTNMLDSVFTFDRILANADRKVLYPLCQDFIPNLAAWEKYAEALLQDSKLFIDLIKGVNNASLFKLKV